MSNEADTIPQQWSDIRLDSRIVEALRDLRWKAPTTVQAACIPHALRGSDVSLQSRTGSGKTGAFVIPMVQRLLQHREHASRETAPKPLGLILVPSVELCEQTVEATNGVCKYVKPRALVENLLTTGSITAAKIQSADIIVSTAAVLAKAIRGGAINETTFAGLRLVVIDEADMMVSIAEKSLRSVQSILPSTVQAIVCSATLTEGVAAVKGQLLDNPVNITLTGEDGPAVPSSKRARDDTDDSTVTQQIVLRDNAAKTLKQFYLVATDECHSYTLLFSLFRFKLIEGKTIVFVDEEEHTYKLEHFLQQLGVSSVVYDASLPMNVRLDVLRRFQKGEVLTLICTDNTLESAERLQMTLDDGDDAPPLKKGRKETDKAPNSALHRGVDFNKVRNVIVLDGMTTPSAINMSKYTHRVGRTGRAGEPGTSIVILSLPQTRKVLSDLKAHVESKGDVLKPFKQLDRAEAAKLQYRVDSTLANVTRSATRKLRVATVAAELARSNYLSTHLSQKDGEVLQRLVRRSTKGVRCDKSVLDVPKYMEIKGVDDAGKFAERVNASKRKEQVFSKVTRKQSVDPLRAVVAKVRQAAKSKPKK